MNTAEPGKFVEINTANMRFLWFRGDLLDVWLLQLPAQVIGSVFYIDSPIQRKIIEKGHCSSRGGHVKERERVGKLGMRSEV